MKNKTASSADDKVKALHKKAGKPTPQMKQMLNQAFGLLKEDEMKDYDQEAYKASAWRK